MKKLLTLALFLISVIYSSQFLPYKNIEWVDISTIDKNKLETGDVIILNKKPNIYSIFGHSAIYIKELDVMAEYPKIGSGCFFIPLNNWISEEKERKAIVLRLKKTSPIIRKEILKEIELSKSKKYKFVLNKKNDSGYYCSQWVWNVFYKSMNLDLDSNKGILVLPYDFLLAKDLEVLKF